MQYKRMINNQYSRAVTAQPQQLLGNQQNVFIADNPLMHNTTQLSEAFYFPPHPQLNQLQSPNYQNSHSFMTSFNNPHSSSQNANTPAIYDPRLANVYTSANSGLPVRSHATNLIENTFKSSVPNQSNAIIFNNVAPTLQADQMQQVYRDTNFLPALQLQHSTVDRQAQRAPELMQQAQNFCHNEVAASLNTPQLMQLHHLPSSNQQIFLPTDTFSSTSNGNGKMSNCLPFKVNSSFSTTMNEIYSRQLQPPKSASVGNPPVLLDRINICINNHYADSNYSSPVIDTGDTCTNAAADTPSLSSPIIPSIQHSAVIDPALLIEPTLNNNEINVVAPVPSTVNEPDSTTTSHTPPSTPDNTSNLVASFNAIQSPSTSSTAKIEESFKRAKIPCDSDSCKPKEMTSVPLKHSNKNSEEMEKALENPAKIDLPVPVVDLVTESLFIIGDDVFVKIDDDQFYLGTIIDSKYQRYRVRFDDASEMWCSPKEMRKFGVCDISNTSSVTGEKGPDDSDSGALCVACKKRDFVDVEICERCGRGYHKACTEETSPDSGEWMCKRCSKSMKLDASESRSDKYENCLTATESRKELPYDVQTLHWDSKHRVNEEQIYCYCGKTGQFDCNMLQCCKCLNWYHTGCIRNFQDSLLRGDGFFIFCCTICSAKGNEFLRRLQIDSVDFMHLVLYNLSAKKKHQHNKYHHLTKDIYPFVLSQRQISALPEEWTELNDDDLQQRIQSTLKKNVERFVCGSELKRDYYFYGLRKNGPPPLPLEMPDIRNEISQALEIDDKFLVETLKLKLVKRGKEYSEHPATVAQQVANDAIFSSEKDDTDGKFTSDDEIPIKLILEKEKIKKHGSLSAQFQENQDNIFNEIRQQTTKTETIKSHKRKAFTLSRLYKQPNEIAEKQRFKNAAHSESSSDENSSSSRCTSLDLIIPPPKNFLGVNNPFRTVTAPKKSSNEKKAMSFGRRILGGQAIRNSVVNASALDFSSNLAALKNAGVLPNLNTTNFARAAGQPRMVRTIKRRLSAKDIMIGPNQEVRRRRTRRLSSNVEIISTTTINPISNFFPINPSNSTKSAPPTTIRKHSFSTSASASIQQLTSMKTEMQAATTINKPAAIHGRRLRVRPQNSLPTNSRRNSLSGASTSSSLSSCSGNATPQTAAQQYSESAILSDLQQTVNRYFGVGELIATGEQFSIHAKRLLPSGQTQLLIEWGVNDENSIIADSTTGTETEEKNVSQDSS